MKQEKQEKDSEMGVRETKGRSRGDPGKIHRSLRSSVFRDVGGRGRGEKVLVQRARL